MLRGPGPVDVYPRVLRVLSAPMLGSFNPEVTEQMNDTMGHVCRKDNVLRCLTALDAVLHRNAFEAPTGAGVVAVYHIYGDGG